MKQVKLTLKKAGGMKWPHRFKQYCNHVLEDMESEWEIYRLYREEPEEFAFKMCYDGAKKDCIRFPTQKVPKTEL